MHRQLRPEMQPIIKEVGTEKSFHIFPDFFMYMSIPKLWLKCQVIVWLAYLNFYLVLCNFLSPPFCSGLSLRKWRLLAQRAESPTDYAQHSSSRLQGDKSHSIWGRCNPKQGFGFIVSRWFRSGSWNKLGKSTLWKWDSSYSSPVMHCWTRGIHAGKCVLRRFHVCATITECTYANLDGWAYCAWRLTCRACFSQVQPVQHATIQNNMGVNQAENNIIQ